MQVYYRLSDASNAKPKPPYVSKQVCLQNFLETFAVHSDGIHVIADAVTDETYDWLLALLPEGQITRTEFRSGSATFSLATELATRWAPQTPIYLVEDDYLHERAAPEVLLEGLTLGADFVTLYDHPDKYLEPADGGNPECAGGAERTRVYLSKSCHWKETNSTTMTFATTAGTLTRAFRFMEPFLRGRTPRDFQMFLRLRRKGFRVVSSIPGFATHGESRWLSPLTDWEQVAARAQSA